MAAPHLDLSVSEEALESGATAILRHIRPHWDFTRVTFKLFTDGITNKLVGCFNGDFPEDVVLVRVYGQNTDLLIDRKAETENIKLLQGVGFAPPLYATFNNGLAYQYIPGEILTVATVRSPEVYPLVASKLAQLHKIQSPGDRGPVVWDKIEQFISLIPEQYSPPARNERYLSLVAGGVASLRAELCALSSALRSLGSPVVLCHNDLLLANVVRQPNAVSFIDYEYMAPNYQAFDIGNHFAEFAGVTDVDFSRYPEKQLQLDWLRIYLREFNGSEPTDKQLQKLFVQVNKFALAAHLLWATWSLVQAEHSAIDFDFLKYAGMKLQEYFSKKEIFLSMETPS